MGRTSLADTVARQRETAARILDGSREPAIFVTEHEAVYTVGRAGVNRKASKGDPARYPSVRDPSLAAAGLVVELDRGGDVTWHGPGQVVVYPVLPLKRLGLSLMGYLRALERAAIEALACHGLEAYARRGMTGIWVRTADGGHGKIGFIGVGCRRWVTCHGLALNVTCDLAAFDRIAPCGIERVNVTRLIDLADRTPSTEGLGREVVETLARTVGFETAEGATASRERLRCG